MAGTDESPCWLSVGGGRGWVGDGWYERVGGWVGGWVVVVCAARRVDASYIVGDSLGRAEGARLPLRGHAVRDKQCRNGCSTVVLIGFTCPAITVVTVIFCLFNCTARGPRPLSLLCYDLDL